MGSVFKKNTTINNVLFVVYRMAARPWENIHEKEMQTSFKKSLKYLNDIYFAIRDFRLKGLKQHANEANNSEKHIVEAHDAKKKLMDTIDDMIPLYIRGSQSTNNSPRRNTTRKRRRHNSNSSNTNSNAYAS